ncbi:hypothetical protein M901_2938 [Bacteriovorax sp. DB6_IX]|nr:hypothetical protein M901_2938 [Bacteriovorax sp. DB6_IX]
MFESSLNLQGQFQFMEKLRQGKYVLIVKTDNCDARKEILITTKSKMDKIRLTCNPNN